MMIEPDGEATGDKAGRIVAVVVLALFGALCAFDSYIAGPITFQTGVGAFLYPLAAIGIWTKRPIAALLPPAFGLVTMIAERRALYIAPLLGWLAPTALWFVLFTRMRKVYPVPSQPPVKNA